MDEVPAVWMRELIEEEWTDDTFELLAVNDSFLPSLRAVVVCSMQMSATLDSRDGDRPSRVEERNGCKREVVARHMTGNNRRYSDTPIALRACMSNALIKVLSLSLSLCATAIPSKALSCPHCHGRNESQTPAKLLSPFQTLLPRSFAKYSPLPSLLRAITAEHSDTPQRMDNLR